MKTIIIKKGDRLVPVGEEKVEKPKKPELDLWKVQMDLYEQFITETDEKENKKILDRLCNVEKLIVEQNKKIEIEADRSVRDNTSKRNFMSSLLDSAAKVSVALIGLGTSIYSISEWKKVHANDMDAETQGWYSTNATTKETRRFINPFR